MSSAANSSPSPRGQFAIVGQACRFPGADNPDALWQQLLEGVDCRSELTNSHLGADVTAYTGNKGEADRFYCTRGGYIRDFEFDPAGFELAEAQLQSLDESQQWLLTVARDALIDAGIAKNQRAKTGVVVGALSFPDKQTNSYCLPLYHNTVKSALASVLDKQDTESSIPFSASGNTRLSNASDAAANIARALGLGPSYFSLDAACASSLYAIKLACDYLAQGKTDVMLAAAVSGADPLFIHMGFSIFQAFPGNGISAPFSPDSQGLFAGEGAAVLVIKRLEDAQAQGDRILGVIQGAGLSNDGRGQFVLSPNPKGQIAAFERAWLQASEHGFTPGQVDVIECHATGTPLGDKVELGSLDSFFGDKLPAPPSSYCPLIGSAKGNVGHLLTAAGMVSMVKTLKGMQQGIVPASPGLSPGSESGSGSEAAQTATAAGFTTEFATGFAERVARTQQAWPKRADDNTAVNGRKVAGISAFGFGGCNAHLVLTDGPAQSADIEIAPSRQATSSTTLAITGVSAHIGASDSLEALNQTLSQGAVALKELPPKRWKGLEQLLPNHKAPKGGYIDSFQLDMMQFKLPATEEDKLIPQQLLLLKQADIAIRDAGLKTGSKTAVLVAMETEPELHQFRGRVELHTLLPGYLEQLGIQLTQAEYQQLEPLVMDAVLGKAQLNQYTSFIGNIMASRVAALWDFSGPAFTMSAGEQGFARGVEVARQLIDAGDADAVVLCSVDLAGGAEAYLLGANMDQPPADAAAAMVLCSSGQLALDSKQYGQLSTPVFSLDVASNSASPSALADTLLTHLGGQYPNTTICRHVLAGSGALLADVPTLKTAEILGHSGAASGMVAAVSALLSDACYNLEPNSHSNKQSAPETATCMLTSRQDELSSALLLTQSSSDKAALKRRLDQGIQPHEGPSLVKTFTLGGESIADQVRQAALQVLGHYLNKPNTMNSANTAHTPEHTSKNMQALETTQDSETVFTPDTHSVNGAETPEHSANHPVYDNAQTSNRDLMSEVHIEFLKGRHHGLSQADKLLKQEIAAILGQSHSIGAATQTAQASIAQSAHISSQASSSQADPSQAAQSIADPSLVAPTIQNQTLESQPATTAAKTCIWDYDDLLEYAEGSIAKVFGPEYAEIDSFRRRVRLPSRDYLLVSRVTKLDAQLGQYQPSTMTTEYDIPVDAPYLVDGQIPWAVAVESGQCDLMLISYLGIDFENRGDRVYRLLDCTLTFLGDLPGGGDTLRYDISINHYARNGDTLLFFFSYRCYVGDTLILKMDNGCAGFFTDKELEDGKGVIRTEAEETARRNAIKGNFTPLLECPTTQFNREQLEPLLTADLVACFGDSHKPAHAAQKQDSLRFASHKFMMIEQISSLDAKGGAWGLGEVVGHKFLEPDHWYFPCHFKGDEVMAGSLMAEGCGQLLQFYMLWLGMHSQMQDARFQPLIDAPQKVRCRGQVLPQSATLTYRMEVTELTMHPTPRARANIDILLDGKVVVDFQNLGVMLKENTDCHQYSDDSIQSTAGQSSHETAPLMQKVPDQEALTNKGVIPFKHVPAPVMTRFANRTPDTLPFTPWHLFEFATGDIENCFGPEFSVYLGMVPPRTPCGDLQLTTSVTHIDGVRGEFKSISSCRAEYEVPQDAWYFKANSHVSQMPYSVLMEIALQPNGFLSGYLGTTLRYQDEPLFFRNLDGKGELLRDLDLRGQTIINDTVLNSTIFSGANIIQKFSFILSTKTDSGAIPFYRGEAVFGYFNDHALTHQAGLDRGETLEPWHITRDQKVDIELDLNAINAFVPAPNKPHWHLAGGQLNFVDTIAIIKDGGQQGLGYAYGERTVDASDWFFPCHFHQDPVMPGSLGVEAMLELLQAFALETGLGDGFKNPRFSWPQSEVLWKYRGQITPHNKQMSLELHITAIEQDEAGLHLTANASLSKDKLRIYEISNLAIRITEAD